MIEWIFNLFWWLREMVTYLVWLYSGMIWWCMLALLWPWDVNAATLSSHLLFCKCCYNVLACFIKTTLHNCVWVFFMQSAGLRREKQNLRRSTMPFIKDTQRYAVLGQRCLIKSIYPTYIICNIYICNNSSVSMFLFIVYKLEYSEKYSSP